MPLCVKTYFSRYVLGFSEGARHHRVQPFSFPPHGGKEGEMTGQPKTTLSEQWGNFTAIPNQFIEKMASLPPRALSLFVALRFFTHRRKQLAFPSYAELQQLTGLSRATISDGLSDLSGAGWLRKERQFGAATHYILVKPVDDPATQNGAHSSLISELLHDTHSSSETELSVVQKLNYCSSEIELLHDKERARGKTEKKKIEKKKTEKNKDMSTSLTAPVAQTSPVVIVFDHWRTVLHHEKAILDTKRKKLIQARLKEGFSPADLCAAVDGCAASLWHMGGNDRAQIYDGCELIFRDAAHVEQFKEIIGGNGNGAHSNQANNAGGSGNKWNKAIAGFGLNARRIGGAPSGAES
jgi:hypothetical protein